MITDNVKFLYQNYFSKSRINKIKIFYNLYSAFQRRVNYNFFKIINDEKVVFIDGISNFIFYKINNPKKKIKRITGLDYLNYKLKSTKKKFFFLLPNKQIFLRIKQKVKLINPELKIDSHFLPRKQHFHEKDLKVIINKCSNFKAEILVIGISCPKQEILAHQLKKIYNFEEIICSGKAVDYFSKNMNFAFYFLRKCGLEWFYRFCTEPVRILPRITYAPLCLFFFVFIEKFFKLFYVKIRLFKSFNINKKKFIYIGFNFAFYNYLYRFKFNLNKFCFFWPDGIFVKFFNKSFNKIPGYKLINKIRINNKINSIKVIGNYNPQINFWLKKKFKVKIKYKKLKIFNLEEIKNVKVPKIFPNELILINIPTPKQEILALRIFNKYNYGKIICIGGGLNIISGYEEKCPEFVDNLYLESLWRLQYDTLRRLKRLFENCIIFIISFFHKFHKRVIFLNQNVR